MRGQVVQDAGGDYHAGRVLRPAGAGWDKPFQHQVSAADHQDQDGSCEQDTEEKMAFFRQVTAGTAGERIVRMPEGFRNERIIAPGFNELAVFVQVSDPGTHFGFTAGTPVILRFLAEDIGLMDGACILGRLFSDRNAGRSLLGRFGTEAFLQFRTALLAAL